MRTPAPLPLAAALLAAAVPAAAADYGLELASSPFVTQIKAPSAYSLGATGRGVIVALVDTGLYTAHQEFARSGKILPGYNVIKNNGDVTDTVGHGTHVAGVLGALRDGAGIEGVAYDVAILPIKIFGATGGTSENYFNAGVRYAIGKAQVVNLSVAAGSPMGKTGMQAAVNGGLLLVAAAGNSGRANPDWPARYAKETWANGQIIAVGAVDANNQIASFSNRAGDTKNYYLVAPGVDILSSYIGGTSAYKKLSGTSMATPVVSGAAAVVFSYWPQLKAGQVADILFQTATDLGAPGVDAVYGRGLVNLEKALQPIGTPQLVTSSGGRTAVTTAAWRPGAAYAAAISRAAASGAFRAAALDDFGRQYYYDLGQGVAAPSPLTLDQVLAPVDWQMNVSERLFADGSRFAAVSAQRQPFADDPIARFERRALPEAALGGFAFVGRNGHGDWTVGSGYAHAYFGLAGSDSPVGRQAGSAFANPYLGLLAGGSHVGAGFEFAPGWKLRTGVVSATATSLASAQGIAAAGRGASIVAELSREGDGHVLLASLLRLDEQGSLLGGQQGEAFAFANGARTTVASFSAAAAVAPGWVAAAQFSVGRTESVGAPGSLIAGVTPGVSQAFVAGVAGADVWRAGDRLGFNVSQPLRAISGRLRFDLPTDVTADGVLVRTSSDVGLRPDARELRFALSYFTPLSRHDGIGFVAMTRLHPDHLADARTEHLVALRWNRAF